LIEKNGLEILAFLLGVCFREAWGASVMLGIGVLFLLKIFSKDKLTASQQTSKVGN
jgi:hypothetical protein